MLLGVLAHGAAGNWDEIIGIGVAVLFVLIFVGVWLYGRRFTPKLEDDPSDESVSE